MLSTIRFRWRRSATALISLACPVLLLAGVAATASPASASSWMTSQLTPPGSAFRNIASVATSPTSMEVFWVAQNGSVKEEYWLGTAWSSTTIAPTFNPRQITAVSRAPNTMEVWWIGPANSVQDAYFFLPPETWKFFTLEPAGSAEFALAATSRTANSMDVFFRANGGNEVENASFVPPWYPPQPLEAPGPLALGGITAISRTSSSEDVFWVTWSGAIEHAWK